MLARDALPEEVKMQQVSRHPSSTWLQVGQSSRVSDEEILHHVET